MKSFLVVFAVTSVACGNVFQPMPGDDDHPDGGNALGWFGQRIRRRDWSIELVPSALGISGQGGRVALPPAPKSVTFTNKTASATTIVAQISGADATSFTIDHTA